MILNWRGAMTNFLFIKRPWNGNDGHGENATTEAPRHQRALRRAASDGVMPYGKVRAAWGRLVHVARRGMCDAQREVAIPFDAKLCVRMHST